MSQKKAKQKELKKVGPQASPEIDLSLNEINYRVPEFDLVIPNFDIELIDLQHQIPEITLEISEIKNAQKLPIKSTTDI